MSIYEQAEDLHLFLEQNDITDKVTLIGHSLGAKVAMAYSLLHPDKVDALCSIDSPPVDRNEFPEMNIKTLSLVEQVIELVPSIESRSYKEAWAWLRSMLKLDNKILISSMMMNLDKTSLEKARLLINIEGLAKNLPSIMSFPYIEDHCTSNLSASNLLFINGGDSMQIQIESDI